MLANWLRKQSHRLSPRWMARLSNYYIPFLGAGIRVVDISEDYRYLRAEMPLTWYNSNFVGTHFGGSIYALTDPFLMMMLMKNLGREYIVWDKSAKIDFLKPGRSRLSVEFSWTKEEIDLVKAATEHGQRFLIEKHVDIRDGRGEVIATVNKTLYIRLKKLAFSQK